MRTLVFLLLLFNGPLFAQVFVPGQTYYSADSLIEYRCGNLPLIITSPHGGYLEPANIPDRTCPGAVVIRDGFTQELSRVIDSVFIQYHGCQPHIIINRLHRKKLDPNRQLSIATCDSPQAAASWEAFHTFADSAKALIIRSFGSGLLLDIHGHAHTIQRLELGYQLTGDQLRSGDSAINSAFRVQRSGIRNLVASNLTGRNHVELLRGETALGTQLHLAGYASVPSQQIPFPLTGELYFSGAYITERHGSMNGGAIDAVQLEHQMAGVRENAATRRAYADTLRRVVVRFLQQHYFGDTSFLNCMPITSSIAVRQQNLARVYPNPSNQLTIETQEEARLFLFDLQGGLISQQPLSLGHNTLSTLPRTAGVYLLRLQFNSGATGHFRWIYTE